MENIGLVVVVMFVMEVLKVEVWCIFVLFDSLGFMFIKFM